MALMWPGATAPERRDATSSATTDRLLRKDVRLRCVGTKADDHRDVLNIPSLAEHHDADDCVDRVVASFVKLLA